jgi:hypothetical protein
MLNEIQLRRFWAKVQKTGGCWLWLASKQGEYGQFGVNGTPQRAHRISYELTNGPIPHGLHIDHLCRTPLCVNPAHLEAVSPVENTLRGLLPQRTRERHAARTTCKFGHSYDAATTAISSTARGYKFRRCRACARIKSRIKRGWNPEEAITSGLCNRWSRHVSRVTPEVET